MLLNAFYFIFNCIFFIDTSQVREDKKGRGGFIRELPADYAVYNKRDNHARLRFSLSNITTEQIMTEKAEFWLKLTYLRSYVNGGKAQFFFCGKMVGDPNSRWDIYGLWHQDDLADKRVSLAVTFETLLSHVHCEQFQEKVPYIDVFHRINTNCNPSDNCTADMRFVDRPWGRQKIKIMDVHMCRL